MLKVPHCEPLSTENEGKMAANVGNLGSGHERKKYLESNKLFATDNGKFPAIKGF